MSAGRTRVALMAGLLLLPACSASPTGGANAPDVVGTWTYTARQVAPATTLSGTLVVSNQSGDTFNGQLQVVETDQAGVQRQRAGVVTGTATSASTLDFDVFLEDGGRRHVGRMAGDSVSGSWADEPQAGTSHSGTFLMRRRSGR